MLDCKCTKLVSLLEKLAFQSRQFSDGINRAEYQQDGLARGYRYYTEEDVRLAQGLEPLERASKTIVTWSVSSSSQKPELVNQVVAMSASQRESRHYS